MSDQLDQAPEVGSFVDTPAGPEPELSPRRPKRRRGLLVTAVAVALIAAGTAVVVLVNRDDAAPERAAGPRTATAAVTRTDLVQTQRVEGTLGYDGSYRATGPGRGIVTWLPDVGGELTRGERAYAINGVSVPLFYGGTPLYRQLSVGVPDGPDVRVLKRNLKALGYGAALAADDHYSPGTADAVREWQDDVGHERTGEISPGDALVEPGALRVTEALGIIGAPAEGPLLSASGTHRVVTVDLPVAQQQLARRGAKVTVQLPGGKTTEGKIDRVGTVAHNPQGDDARGSGSGGQSPSPQDATVSVRVTLTKPKDAGNLDGAPVSVDFTSDRHDNVLAVPVTALLALAEGGYAVETPQGHLIPVRLGAFAGGKVEVSGNGLTEGLRVEVPRT